MFKSSLLLSLLLAASGMVDAASVYVSASGQFAPSDIPNSLVSPGAGFVLRFTVDTNPVPVAGSVTTLGFDVPITSFSYLLSGNPVSAVPSEIRFNTPGDLGLLTVFFRSAFNHPVFSFRGPQAFSGSTTSPIVTPASYPISAFNYTDAVNFDSQSPVRSSVLITPTPEPSSFLLLLCGFVSLIAVTVRQSVRMR